jgi:apolipoprotein N-acyltransferase
VAAVLALYLAAALGLFARWRTRRPLADAALFAALWLLAELRAACCSPVSHGSPRATPRSTRHWPSSLRGSACTAWAPSARSSPRRSRWGGRRPARAAPPSSPWRRWRSTSPTTTPGPIEFTSPTRTLQVTLLQGNIPQEEKFASEHLGAALEWHVGRLLEAHSDLVVAPRDRGAAAAAAAARGLLGGPCRPAFASGRTHCAVRRAARRVRQAATRTPRSASPRAPRVPLRQAPPGAVRRVHPAGLPLVHADDEHPARRLQPRPLEAPSFGVGRERIAPNICYEDLFGEELAARFADAAQAPTMFANISNIGWFGNTIAVEQHLNISRLRTLEFQRPMLRATNTGATVIIDHRGAVTESLKPYTRGVLEGAVQGRDGATPYARWAAHYGLWPPALLAAACVAAFAWLALRREAAPGQSNGPAGGPL